MGRAKSRRTSLDCRDTARASEFEHVEVAMRLDAENGPQLRSRVEKILNVAQRLRLRFSLGCGLVG